MRPRPMIQSGSIVRLSRHRGGYSTMSNARQPPHDHRSANAVSTIDRVITGLMLLAIVTAFTIPPALLTEWNIHYLSTGGNFYEKMHPATYAAFLAWLLLLIRNGDPVGEINRALSEARLVLIYLFCWLALLVQMFALERPFTVIIDTFLLPVVICLVIWRLPAVQRKPLLRAIHVTILLNIVLGYYEYFSGHRLIPLTLGSSVVVADEWRSSALLGHPLDASGVVAAYVLALIVRPALCPPVVLRLPLIAFCLGSLMAFGGRTALITVLTIIGGIALLEILRLIRGKRTTLPAVIAGISLLFVAAAGIFAASESGVFNKMLLRFSSDKGSTLARYATFDLLSHFDWHELVLGPDPARVAALQTQLGLNYGIENFWISCAVQFGIVHTALLTIGLMCFFAEILRRVSGGAWAVMLLILMVAASSVSFSSKSIQLAQFVILVTLLLPREQRRAAASASPSASGKYQSILSRHTL
jgi:hypothetical protein